MGWFKLKYPWGKIGDPDANREGGGNNLFCCKPCKLRRALASTTIASASLKVESRRRWYAQSRSTCHCSQEILRHHCFQCMVDAATSGQMRVSRSRLGPELEHTEGAYACQRFLRGRPVSERSQISPIEESPITSWDSTPRSPRQDQAGARPGSGFVSPGLSA